MRTRPPQPFPEFCETRVERHDGSIGELWGW